MKLAKTFKEQLNDTLKQRFDEEFYLFLVTYLKEAWPALSSLAGGTPDSRVAVSYGERAALGAGW